jgi:ribosome-associated translation inhibitor RaiA
MTQTRIEFRGGAAGRAIRARVTAGLARVLASLPVEPTTARVAFTDENGPKGGVAIRCALEIHLPRQTAVRVEEVATTPRLALDAGLDKLERRLRRVRQSARQAKRRPKKYYAAGRALAAG